MKDFTIFDQSLPCSEPTSAFEESQFFGGRFTPQDGISVRVTPEAFEHSAMLDLGFEVSLKTGP